MKKIQLILTMLLFSISVNSQTLINLKSIKGGASGQIPFSTTSGTLTTLTSSTSLTYSNSILNLGSAVANYSTYVTDSEPILTIARTTNSTTTSNAHSFVDASIFIKNSAGYANNAFTDNGQIFGTVAYDHHASFQSQFIYAGSNTLSKLYGFVDIPKVNAGTIAARYGVYLFDATGGGSIATQYGIYIPSLTKGTTNYAIYTASSTPSFFGGNLTVGATTNSQLSLQGAFATTGDLQIGSLISNLGNNNLNITPSTSGTNGNKLVLGYYNGSAFKSAFEYGHTTAAATTTISMVKGGGTLLVGGLSFFGGTTTPTAYIHAAASTTATASIRITNGVAPTSPNDGDMWFDGTHLYIRIAGVTKQLDN